MSHRLQIWLVAFFCLLGASRGGADDDLPEGPIRERHELMEVVGAHGKVLGAAMKSGDYRQIAMAARGMEVASANLPALFPDGSRHPRSRALAKIWDEWSLFEQMTEELSIAAAEVAYVADSHGDLAEPVQRLFRACKTCHETFRTPEP